MGYEDDNKNQLSSQDFVDTAKGGKGLYDKAKDAHQKSIASDVAQQESIEAEKEAAAAQQEADTAAKEAENVGPSAEKAAENVTDAPKANGSSSPYSEVTNNPSTDTHNTANQNQSGTNKQNTQTPQGTQANHSTKEPINSSSPNMANNGNGESSKFGANNAKVENDHSAGGTNKSAASQPKDANNVANGGANASQSGSQASAQSLKGASEANKAEKAADAARKAVDAQRNAVAAAKAAKTSKTVRTIAVGGVVGKAASLLTDKRVWKTIGIVILVISLLFMFVLMAVPMAIYEAVEYFANALGDFFSNLIDWVIGALDNIRSFFGNPRTDKDYTSLNLNDYLDEYASTEIYAPTGEDASKKTINNKINLTMDRMTKRINTLSNYCKTVFNKTVSENSDDPNVSFVCNIIIPPSLSTGIATQKLNALKLVSLYSIQYDCDFGNIDLLEYLDWLGYYMEDVTITDQTGAAALAPLDWEGTFIPQWQIEQNKQEVNDYLKTAGRDANPEDAPITEFVNDNTSALSYFAYLVSPEPTITSITWIEDIKDEYGFVIGSETYTEYTLTFNIRARSISEVEEKAGLWEGPLTLDSAQKQEQMLTWTQGGVSTDSLFTDYHNALRKSDFCRLQAYQTDRYRDLITTTSAYIGLTNEAGEVQFAGNSNRIVSIAIAEAEKAAAGTPGTRETVDDYGGADDVLYNEWMYGVPVHNIDSNNDGRYYDDDSPEYYPWSCTFLSWCANKCGYIESGLFLKQSDCSEEYNFLITGSSNKQAFATYHATDITPFGGNLYTPVPGDLLFFNDSDQGLLDKLGHVGIIVKVTENSLVVVEGNSGYTVKLNYYSLGTNAKVDNGYVVHVEYPAYQYENSGEIYSFLTNEMNLTKIAACAAMGNMMGESSCIADLIEHGYTWESGAGYGLIQWTNTDNHGRMYGSDNENLIGPGEPYVAISGHRRTNLLNYCTANNLDYTTAEGQLAFLKYELNAYPIYAKALSDMNACPDTTQGLYDATEIWLRKIEGIFNQYTYNKRCDYALEFYQ